MRSPPALQPTFRRAFLSNYPAAAYRPVSDKAFIANLYAPTAVTTLWLPGKYDVARYVLTNSTEQIALTVPVNMLQEFWPEVVHKSLSPTYKHRKIEHDILLS